MQFERAHVRMCLCFRYIFFVFHLFVGCTILWCWWYIHNVWCGHTNIRNSHHTDTACSLAIFTFELWTKFIHITCWCMHSKHLQIRNLANEMQRWKKIIQQVSTNNHQPQWQPKMNKNNTKANCGGNVRIKCGNLLTEKLRISFPALALFVASEFRCHIGTARSIHQTVWHLRNNFPRWKYASYFRS